MCMSLMNFVNNWFIFAKQIYVAISKTKFELIESECIKE